MEYPQAHALSAALLCLSFLAMQAVYTLNRRRVEGI